MIIALAGGVGGARLANGLAAILPAGSLLIAVNVGDDFQHLGLTICPDLDTVTCTLAGINDSQRGWGMKDETWSFMESIRTLGGPDWFALGDKDLAKHVLRTHQLRSGQALSETIADFSRSYGIAQTIVPATDDPVRTTIKTDEGNLAFQDYFVRRRCAPRFLAAHYEGAKTARPSNTLMAALVDPKLEAVIICPSNPLLSIGPILAMPACAEALRNRKAPCVAISPFISGEAVKGPAAKIMRELNLVPGAAALLKSYSGLIDGILCDETDADRDAVKEGVTIKATNILMRDASDQQRLAMEALEFAATLR